MPLTPFQQELLATLAGGGGADRYLAGGAAIHFAPNSTRFSDDLDFFHDSEARVAAAFAADRDRLVASGYLVDVEISQPGFVRTIVRRADGRTEDATRVDWAHDSVWRFMPLVRDALGGFMLHPVDLAINKVMALAGRDEARDFVDILFVHETVLRLASLVWAAAGKDPGFTPRSLLELLKRRGRHRPEDVARLHLTQPFDLVEAKQQWLAALEEAETFVRERPSAEAGCLYYSTRSGRFVVPGGRVEDDDSIVPHFGAPGGVVPRVGP